MNFSPFDDSTTVPHSIMDFPTTFGKYPSRSPGDDCGIVMALVTSARERIPDLESMMTPGSIPPGAIALLSDSTVGYLVYTPEKTTLWLVTPDRTFRTFDYLTVTEEDITQALAELRGEEAEVLPLTTEDTPEAPEVKLIDRGVPWPIPTDRVKELARIGGATRVTNYTQDSPGSALASLTAAAGLAIGLEPRDDDDVRGVLVGQGDNIVLCVPVAMEDSTPDEPHFHLVTVYNQDGSVKRDHVGPETRLGSSVGRLISEGISLLTLQKIERDGDIDALNSGLSCVPAAA